MLVAYLPIRFLWLIYFGTIFSYNLFSFVNFLTSKNYQFTMYDNDNIIIINIDKNI